MAPEEKKPPPPAPVPAPAPVAPTSNGGSVPQEFSTDTPATVPLTEDITYGTLMPPAATPAPAPSSVPPAGTANGSAPASASAVFEPKYVSEDEKNREATAGNSGPAEPPELLNDEGSLGNTVASSTYGEDRQKVVKQPLLDPYGDKGIYTGVVLRSTGMPHGLGRMVYEEDGRIYEGDWYVGSRTLV